MSLLVLMYHRAREGQFGNSPGMLDAHFAHISQSYANVLPGEAPIGGQLNVCLSFDDGFFDFYAIVFPLLKRHNLRALLAIPPRVVRENVNAPYAERLAVNSDAAFADPNSSGFCTWIELKEMAGSGHVMFAAHGLTHRSLANPQADLALEVESPKALLASRLGQPIESFVFPFGRYSPPALQRAQQHYRHVFRIGGAINRGANRPLLYRVDADGMRTPRSLFAPSRLASYHARFWWNRLRGR